MKPTEERLKPKVQGRVYDFTEKDVEVSKFVLIGILPLFTHDAWILIDLGSTHSFIACDYVKYSDSTPKPLVFYCLFLHHLVRL